VSPTFAASQRAKGTIFYSMKAIRQVILVPAWRLLRPDQDPIAKRIPSDTRRELLKLDPFIKNLDKFFPDSGADLNEAANPYADPSANNRAELIGRHWLDSGTELAYQLGSAKQLSGMQSGDLAFTTTVKISAGASTGDVKQPDKAGGVDAPGGVGTDPFGALKISLGMDVENKATIDYASSQETDAATIKNASCFLIRHTGDTDEDGIALYFDRVFSTFMFRRIKTTLAGIPKQPGSRPPFVPNQFGGGIGPGVIAGRVLDWRGVALRGLQIMLMDKKGRAEQTSAAIDGQFFFYNLPVGRYTLTAGDRTVGVTIEHGCDLLNPLEIKLQRVRRIIDLARSPIWELEDALHIPARTLREYFGRFKNVTSHSELAGLVGADSARIQEWRRAVVFARGGRKIPTATQAKKRKRTR
jgi:hypothetical protein